MATIVALIHGEPGSYGISFPDFPGVASGGTTLGEAIRRGREALATHVEALIADAIPLPVPRELDALTADATLAEAVADAVVVAAVTLDLPGKSMRVNVSIDETLLARIDEHVRAHGGNRSRFLAEAARARLAS